MKFIKIQALATAANLKQTRQQKMQKKARMDNF